MSDTHNQPVALITGGAVRVGRAIVCDLADRGYRLAVHAHSSLAEAEQLVEELARRGCAAAAFAADLRDEAAARAMIDHAFGHFGRLDALVNNAAIWSPSPLATATADDVRRYFEANTLSTFVCCRHAGLLMARQERGGAIVNIGDWATRRPYRDYGPYFVSKGAIPTLTRMFAVELAPKVRVNAVLPGPVLMPHDLSAHQQQGAIAGTLLKRAGRPENVAQAVAHLLENDFVTGVCLPVDGGRSIGGAE
jgi:pteridine reductase